MTASALPLRCVIDTNVAKTANGEHTGASAECESACAIALQVFLKQGHLFIDDAFGDSQENNRRESRIVTEYSLNLSRRGQPGPGDAFFKWVLDNEWYEDKITRVPITPCQRDSDIGFAELPSPPEGVHYDPSDRKFLAVAAAHPEHPPIWQALDSKWWGWTAALAEAGISVHFLCPEEIARKHREKMGT